MRTREKPPLRNPPFLVKHKQQHTDTYRRRSTTPIRAHVPRGTSNNPNHTPQSKYLPHTRNSYLCCRRNPTKKGYSAKTCSTKRKKEIYDRIDTPLLSIGQAADEFGIDTYNIGTRPEVAEPLYNEVVRALEERLGRPIGTGRFGADMQVSLTNDGPVTIWIDSKARE